MMFAMVFTLAAALLMLLTASVHGQLGHVVRFVDRYGVQHTTDTNSPYNAYFRLFRCPREGFFRHPNNCQRFFRCVSEHQQQVPVYTVYEFECPSNLNFDERFGVCNWPSSAPSCQSSSWAQVEPGIDFRCPHDGYFRDPYDCKLFYRCETIDGLLKKFRFLCPFDLVFDVGRQICNWKWLVGPPCSDGTRMHNVRMAGINVNGTDILSNRSRSQSEIESAMNVFTSALNGPTYISQRQLPPNPNSNASTISTGVQTGRPYPPMSSTSWFKPNYAIGTHRPSLHHMNNPIDQWHLLSTQPNVYLRSRPQYAVRPEIPSIHVSFYQHPFYYKSSEAQQMANRLKR